LRTQTYFAFRSFFMQLSVLSTALAAAALIAAAPVAQAVVVTSPAANLTVPVTSAGLYINVVTGASPTASFTGYDINPWGTSSFRVWTPTTGGAVGSTTALTGLAPGSVVSSSSIFSTSPGGAATTAGWSFNSLNYFGFSFINEVDGLLHYGYGVVQIGATFVDPARKLVSVYYESTAGAPITVAAAVPEPSAWAMALGGLALLGAVVRRRGNAA